jgi:methylated-DNA-protein-cysteine methyltransferase-like protein
MTVDRDNTGDHDNTGDRDNDEEDIGPLSFEAAVDRVLRSLRRGDVVTYGEVAVEAGFPGAARAVGRVLARSGGSYPWWRVVTASGRLVPGHEEEHARRLAAEGVRTNAGRVRWPR